MVLYSKNYIVKPINNWVTIIALPISSNKIPQTPFDEDVIVHFFNDNISLSQSMDTASDKINDFFCGSIWDTAKSVFQSRTGEDPTKVTMITTTPEYTYINYVEVEKRKTNTGHIDKTLIQDWGFEISLTITLNGSTVVQILA